mgnify:CR=1 FL=1
MWITGINSPGSYSTILNTSWGLHLAISIWKSCVERLEGELSPQQFNTWIRPLQAVESPGVVQLYAPNRFVLDWVKEQYFDQIGEIIKNLSVNSECLLMIEVGTQKQKESVSTNTPKPVSLLKSKAKSNQLSRAAAMQVGNNPNSGFNPLFIYGGVGLGKTHLMHAVGSAILMHKPDANIAYLHSERFVADMVRALQHNAINEFKRYYRSLDALLIDDIQFFAGKERSQEEFFHTFNALLEGQQQVILTCDKYPKEVLGLEERLKSRFG